MGKATGFLEYERVTGKSKSVKKRIKNFQEFHTPLSKEKQQLQAARCMACGVPFCQSGIVLNNMTTGCPLHNLIPEWNDLIYTGNWEEAYRRLNKTNNFPEFTARVCPAPCEAACTCGLNDTSVSIRENEYGVIENAFASGYVSAKPPKVRTGKTVAIVGSGPSGLAAAAQLNKRGHSVTVFERNDRVGGLLQYGIPNMKLQKEVIARRVHIMKEEGITFVINTDVGKNYKAAALLKKFDRVILACGASKPRDIKVEGRDAKGIYFAVDFLTSVTKSLLDSDLKDKKVIPLQDKKVLVIGGGDTGNDCVGTAIRLGAGSVVQLEMMPQLPSKRAEFNPWPEWAKVCKVDYGQEEAIDVFGQDSRVYETTVTGFISNKAGEVCGAKTVKLEMQKEETTGRMNMVPIKGSEEVMEADIVLIAAGFLGSEEYITKAFKVDLDERGNVASKNGMYQTSVEKVFTTGDMHRGQSLVVWAIREGREVANEVDYSLIGYSNL